MGNINALRDWGHAKDYVKMQWLMLQQNKPKDYVIASGEQFSVRQFIIWAARYLGLELEFSGKGVDEVARVKKVIGSLASKELVGKIIMRIDKRYFRPAEVETLLGDATEAKKDLGWLPKISVEELCEEMVREDYTDVKRRLMTNTII